MLRFLPGFIKGILASLSYGLNTIFWAIPLLICALFKFIIPIPAWRNLCTIGVNFFADCWVATNSFTMNQLNEIEFVVKGDFPESTRDWYLIVANHRSWVDIIAMQHILRGKVPFLKFFLKQELIYIPVIGLAWWALDFPFMKRYSKSTLRKKPHLKGKDIEETRRACEKFKTIPISIVNFVEGTRFTEAKHKQQGEPFENLLRPRSGGIGYVMSMLGEQIHYILDITFFYPDENTDYWQFVTGKCKRIEIRIDSIPVDDSLRGDYINDPTFRARFQTWLTDRWKQKDAILNDARASGSLPAPGTDD